MGLVTDNLVSNCFIISIEVSIRLGFAPVADNEYQNKIKWKLKLYEY